MRHAKKKIKCPKLQSSFALLDVKSGRKGLHKIVGGQGTEYPETGKRIPVTIRGFIVGAWGHDDGTSREFGVEITDIKTGAVK